MEKITFTGALDDNRSEEDKAKDWQSSAFIDWENVALGDDVQDMTFDDIHLLKVKGFKAPNQSTSLSCVAQTLAMMMSIEIYRETGVWHELSSSFIYNRRSNKPYGGMIGINALELNKDLGALFETLMASQNMTERQIAEVVEYPHFKRVAKAFAGLGFAFVPFDMKKMAYINSSVKNKLHKPIMTWYRFPRNEWTPEPKISTSKTDLVHHSITGVQAGKYKGKAGMFSLDSSMLNTTNKGFRFVNEDYLPRMTFCAYVDDFSKVWRDNPNVPDIEKPKVLITETLRRNSKGNQVKMLQDVLKYEQCIPQKTIVDGNFGAVTESGVRNFQKKNSLAIDGIVGKNTREFIAKLYS